MFAQRDIIKIMILASNAMINALLVQIPVTPPAKNVSSLTS